MNLIDFHTHPVLKPCNSSLNPNQLEALWKEFSEPEACKALSLPIRLAIKSTDKHSQSDLSKATRGGINGMFFALGPVERPFFKPRVKNLLLKLFLPEKDYATLALSVTSFCKEKVDKIFERNDTERGVDYFNEELVPEFNYILSQEKNTSSLNHFKIATNYQEFISILQHEPNTIAVILTIEGGHSFGNFQFNDFTLDFSSTNLTDNYHRHKATFLGNIQTMKQSWGNKTPFFVTLCHHFWNLLSGHSKSMSPSGLMPGMDAIIDQTANMNTGMTEVGKEVVKTLLSSDEHNRRILIDIKHMSVESRKWYYSFVRAQRIKGDHIPIVCSHTSLNLYDTMEEATAAEDNFSKDRYAFLSKFSINLSNDEIREIAHSKGMIGIILNEGRMPGRLGRKAINDCGKEMSRQKAEIYLKLILCNVFQIIKVVGTKEAWDLICIGSDFDGVIDPFESFSNAETLKELPKQIETYLTQPTFDLDWISVTADDITNHLMFDYTAKEIAEKIAGKNVLLLLENYFHDSYLKKKVSFNDSLAA
jgi:microsomal dipeptidase-like Zn-dependent dipeptidase